jgi:ABC-2 type transport system ATP-binding protein
VIEVEGLSKRFGSRLAVDGLTLTAPAGAIYGFLGPNGAGKSTTIRMLLGILRPDGGTIRICGETVDRGNRVIRMLVGTVSEVQYLYGDMSCREYLMFFARLYGVERPAERALETLAAVGLADRAGDRAIDLSKGLQQKLGLARALLHDPPVLILDEPVSGLDPHGIRDVREIICRERDKGRLVFLSSHVLSEIERTADRIGIIREGKLVYEGTVTGVVERHGSLEDAFVALTGERAEPTRTAS